MLVTKVSFHLPISKKAPVFSRYAFPPSCRHFTSTPTPRYPTSPASHFKGTKHFLTLRDFTPVQILHLIRRSLELKQQITAERAGQALSPLAKGEIAPLASKTLGMIFSKKSTRTRVSAEAGWAYYGGSTMYLGKDDIQLSGGEALRDTSVVISSMVDCLLARVGEHEEVETLAQYSSVPVINALTAKYHPLQALADIMTLYELYLPDALSHKSSPSSTSLPLPLLPKLNIAWVGDGNNIIHSLLVTLPRLGANVSVATPKGYDCAPDVVEYAEEHATGGDERGEISFTRDPEVAVKDADVIVTDTWVSMGQEKEKAKRLAEFKGYQVTEAMAKGAKPDWKFMHCLPRKPEEVDDDVFYNPERSVVFQEAENRKYTVMAVYEMLMLWAKDAPVGK
ncbi:ornithine carbamoyltransferase [Rhizophlyctis rosea]|uniref:ornithine carbamoyltransferase n=1 Tax=Rhizophlyctis rosea TaxID=64517 RepID=A0AAD5X483_9FUNG|nr:ornithine carbamoyltransferase [Rhizophlyctis rosea]